VGRFGRQQAVSTPQRCRGLLSDRQASAVDRPTHVDVRARYVVTGEMRFLSSVSLGGNNIELDARR
jgi:hypothetical protein